jgi:hypothetical protein
MDGSHCRRSLIDYSQQVADEELTLKAERLVPLAHGSDLIPLSSSTSSMVFDGQASTSLGDDYRVPLTPPSRLNAISRFL